MTAAAAATRAKLATRVLADSEHEAWASVVAKSPHGSVYSLPAYLAALCEATGATYRVLAAFRGDEIVGGVALYERRSAFGPYVSPRLLLYYNGVVVRETDTRYPSQRTSKQLECLAALEEGVRGLGYASVKLKSRATLADARPFLDRGWTARPIYSYVVPIADLAAQWDRVEQNLRRLVERCAKQGVALTDDGDFASFFRMHLETHERKGAPLYLPRPAFERWFSRLREAGLCRVFHARLPDGRSVASQLVLLGPHPVTHTVSAAADSEFLNLGASAFLRWRVFEELSKLGYAANDLTDAALNPVTHFKSQLGGDLALCLELTAPEALPYRAARAASDLGARLRGGLASAARRAMRRAPA